MKILILGVNGQVGFELLRTLAPLGEIIPCNRACANLENLIELETFIRKTAPDVIVNAAAYTQVDKAESEQDLAQLINRDATHVMAKLAKELNAWLIYYSSDYVFDGEKLGLYDEEDAINPLSVYGKTKASGEEVIRATGCKHLIIRTSWVYSLRGHNFARTILRLAKEREQLTIINDQIGVLTSADLVADITALMLYRIKWDESFKHFSGGTYHITPQGKTSWHGFASYLLQRAVERGIFFKTKPEKVLAITTDQYPCAAKRPKNSMLNTQKICIQFGVQLPHWQVHADRFLSQTFL